MRMLIAILCYSFNAIKGFVIRIRFYFVSFNPVDSIVIAHQCQTFAHHRYELSKLPWETVNITNAPVTKWQQTSNTTTEQKNSKRVFIATFWEAFFKSPPCFWFDTKKPIPFQSVAVVSRRITA